MSVFAAAPVFTQTGPFSITENSSTGSIVGQVVATGATSYAITAGNGTGGGAFTIDNGGVIRVLDGTQLDYEVNPQFTLTVTATNIDGTTPATVIINVQNVNDPPSFAQSLYTYSINENLPNGTLVGAVSATDSDPADTIVYSLLPGPDAAFFAIDSDDGEIKVGNTAGIDFESGKVQYTIFVQASDGGLNDFATVIITINDANDPPVAVNDGPAGPYTGTENTPLVVIAPGVLGNDSDEDVPPDVLTAVLDTNASHGNVVLNPDGSFTYTPVPQYNGPDSFTYHVFDGTDDSNIATVSLNIIGVNDPPTANDDNIWSTDEDSVLNIPAAGVLTNDTDPEMDPLTVTAFDAISAQGAAVSVNADGSFSYDPTGVAALQALAGGGSTTDTFDYTASDGSMSDSATVTITVNGLNDAPVITEGSSVTVNMDEDGNPTPFSLTLNATDADGDTISWSIVPPGATNGAAAASGTGTSKAIGYTPNPNYTGPDSFDVEISDGNGGTDIITVNVNIAPQNDDPTANDDTATVNEDSVNNMLDVLANDSTLPETGETLSITAVGATNNGGTAVNNSSSIDYTPAANFFGTEVFTYTITDGNGGFDTATVTVTVTSDNDAPVITEGTSVTVNIDEDETPTAFSLTLNATDVEGDTLTWSIFSGASNGTASASGTGASKAIGYDPAPNYFGTDSFVVRVSDGNGGTDDITVNVNIAPQNDDPTANDDTPTVNEDSVNNTLNVLANDSILPDTGETLTITAVGATNNGGTAVNNNTNITYTPALNFNGTEVFTYTISDGNGGFDTATVTVTVTSMNDAPVITEGNSVTVNIDEDENPTAFALTLNATDVEGNTLTWSILTPAAHGTASASGTGNSKVIGYDPAPNYFGTDSFVVRVSDGNGGTDDITVNVNIAPQNDDPTANDDFPTVNEQSSNNTLNVLSNDSIAPDSGETLTITAVGATNNGGTATNNGTNITYTPNPAFIGTETFTYTISDGNGGFDTALVTVTVQDVNFPPVITEGASVTVNMDEDGSPTAFSLTLNATDPDGNTLTWSIFTGASHGVASASGTGNSKAIGYTPNPNYNGTDSFIVRVSDGSGGTDNITVNVNIAPQNDDPTANDDNPTVNEQSSNNTLDVLANDSDAPDNTGETLTITAVGATNNGGTATNNGTNITYTPNPAFIGTETFTYTISDGNGGFDTALVTVTVQDVNFPPVITEGTSVGVTMSEDGSPTPFALTLNATDVDGNTLTWSISSQGTNGTASASGTGNSKAITYTPTANYNGADSFVVQVSDGNGGTDTITVNVTISPVNDNPTAVDDDANTAKDTAVLIYVLTNDTDIDGGTLSVSAVTNGSDGTVTNHGTHVEYTPNAGFEGTDTFTYTASDGNGGTSVATVTVTVGKTYVFLPIIIKPGPQAPDLVVQSVTATNDEVQVVIRNQGPVATSTGFWVDFYVNPSEAPTHANQLWDDLAAEGIAWGITDSVAAGAELTLIYSTAPGAPNLYYSAADSNFTGTLTAGTPVYAQVDSAHLGNANGAVLETHEISGDAYNNVSDEVLATNVTPTWTSTLVGMASSVAAKFGLPSR